MRLRIAILLLLATPLVAAERWYEAYKGGVKAVNAKNYREGANGLQTAISEMPNEGVNVRVGRELVTYTPHFWLGIAKFNLGDVDGALREWRISEEQGVITRTEYYSSLKDWVARAQTEKQRNAQAAATGSKKSADAALSRALEMQLSALRAGGDRTESYQQAQRKLQDARAQFQKAGTDIAGYKASETTAQQAIALFTAAAEEGKRLKDARPAVVPAKKPTVVTIEVPTDQPPPATATVAAQPPPAPTATTAPVQIESEAKVAARLAVQQYRRNAASAPRQAAVIDVRQAERLRIRLEQVRNDADYQQIAREARERDAALAARVAQLTAPKPTPVPVAVVPPAAPTSTATPAPARPDITPAYRAFAVGDLAAADRLLSALLSRQQSAEAFLLRGCARYTRAMLSRNGDSQLAAAAADFRAALQLDRNLRLDRAAFSPKLVAYFERIRSGAR